MNKYFKTSNEYPKINHNNNNSKVLQTITQLHFTKPKIVHKRISSVRKIKSKLESLNWLRSETSHNSPILSSQFCSSNFVVSNNKLYNSGKYGNLNKIIAIKPQSCTNRQNWLGIIYITMSKLYKQEQIKSKKSTICCDSGKLI